MLPNRKTRDISVSRMSKETFKKTALILFAYSLLVILWGAWVRISHSGDGCGDTWPLCHGQLIPEAQRGKTWVEYGHRMMSGLYGFFVFYFYWQARKIFEKTDLARKAALWTLIFTITEALLGAKLVLFKLVTNNDTPLRAAVMGLHQVNSLLLTGAITIAYVATKKSLSTGAAEKQKFWNKNWTLAFLFIGIAITGSWAALAATLFPSSSLLQGLMDDFAADSHYLIKLRGFHPLAAIIIGGSLSAFMWIQSQKSSTDFLKRSANQASVALIIGIAFGVSTLLALSPVWMKIAHLALAQIMWFFVLQFIYAYCSEKADQ